MSINWPEPGRTQSALAQDLEETSEIYTRSWYESAGLLVKRGWCKPLPDGQLPVMPRKSVDDMSDVELSDAVLRRLHLAKRLFEAQFELHGGRKDGDPTWDDIEQHDRDDYLDRAGEAEHVYAPVVAHLSAENKRLRRWAPREVPVEAFPVGTFLEEELDARGVPRSALQEPLGLTADELEELLEGRRPLTRELAERLGRYLNMSPETWLNLDRAYQDWYRTQALEVARFALDQLGHLLDAVNHIVMDTDEDRARHARMLATFREVKAVAEQRFIDHRVQVRPDEDVFEHAARELRRWNTENPASPHFSLHQTGGLDPYIALVCRIAGLIAARRSHAGLSEMSRQIEDLLVEFDGVTLKRLVADEIMNRIVDPALDQLSAAAVRRVAPDEDDVGDLEPEEYVTTTLSGEIRRWGAKR